MQITNGKGGAVPERGRPPFPFRVTFAQSHGLADSRTGHGLYGWRGHLVRGPHPPSPSSDYETFSTLEHGPRIGFGTREALAREPLPPAPQAALPALRRGHQPAPAGDLRHPLSVVTERGPGREVCDPARPPTSHLRVRSENGLGKSVLRRSRLRGEGGAASAPTPPPPPCASSRFPPACSPGPSAPPACARLPAAPACARRRACRRTWGRCRPGGSCPPWDG